jgi:hypothetical protein
MQTPETNPAHAGHEKPDMKPYVKLALALAISFVVMFVTGYARSAAWDHLYLNANRFYMTGAMVAPMALIMLGVMSSMFNDRRLNAIIAGTATVLTLLFWALVRTQGGVGNEGFLKSMIPHHSAAILVCNEADLTDPRIQQLCREIIAAQEREIAEMKALLAE